LYFYNKILDVKSRYLKLIHFLRARLTRMQIIMIIAILTGVASGLIAVLLKTLVHYLQHWLKSIPIPTLAYLLFPAFGLVVTVFIIRHFFGGQIERGIAMVLKAIARKSSFIPSSHTYLHVITSSITVGFGGSVGLEAPIVATGSAVSLRWTNVLPTRFSMLLVTCVAMISRLSGCRCM